MGFLDRLRWKKKPPAAPPQAPAGHRGVAAGSLKPRPDFARTGRTEADLSAANVAKWHTLPPGEVRDFVFDGQLLFVHSTAVAAAQYHIDNGTLLIEYLAKKGQKARSYLYYDVEPHEAISFAQAGSKMGWVWDNLRERGSKYGFKKKYVRIR